MLRQRYGKKLVAGGQGKHAAWSEKDRQAWLADPKNADEIARVRAGGGGTSRHNGADTRDIVAGTISKAARWESEEHLNVGAVPNFHDYITGLVYAGGNANDPYRSGKDFRKRSANPNAALDEFCQLLMGHFQGEKGWAQRDSLMAYMTKFNIPFVYQRQDFPAKQVKERMIAIWRERKAEKTRRSQEVQKSFVVFRNPQGGGVAINAPDFWTATDRALQDMPGKFPNGIFGAQEGNGPKQWFTQPKTEVGTMPPRTTEQPA